MDRHRKETTLHIDLREQLQTVADVPVTWCRCWSQSCWSSTKYSFMACLFLGLTVFLHFNASRIWPPVLSVNDRERARQSASTSSSCDLECRQLHELFLSGNWSVDKPRAAVYFLVMKSRFSILKESLFLLDKNFNRRYDYPVIIFYDEADIDDREVHQFVRSFSTSKLFFQRIRFEIPSFLNESAVPAEASACFSFYGLGYRHMCRFHSALVYQQPIVAALDYALRLDDDSLLCQPIARDLFKFARDRRIIYGYRSVEKEYDECVVGLRTAVERYLARENLVPQPQQNLTVNTIFFNNFELSAMELWMSEPYRKYIDYIDRTGGIYFHRWGDAPIKTVAVALFVPVSRMYRFTDVAYMHKGKIIP